jgi:hypothetical protein
MFMIVNVILQALLSNLIGTIGVAGGAAAAVNLAGQAAIHATNVVVIPLAKKAALVGAGYALAKLTDSNPDSTTTSNSPSEQK